MLGKKNWLSENIFVAPNQAPGYLQVVCCRSEEINCVDMPRSVPHSFYASVRDTLSILAGYIYMEVLGITGFE